MPIEPPDPMKMLIEMIQLGVSQLERFAADRPDNPRLALAVAEIKAAVAKLEKALDRTPKSG